jgi:hypothetical protein
LRRNGIKDGVDEKERIGINQYILIVHVFQNQNEPQLQCPAKERACSSLMIALLSKSFLTVVLVSKLRQSEFLIAMQ